MAVDQDGCVLAPKGGFANASKREIDEFFQRMLVLADDTTLPSEYRAIVTTKMADVHKKIQAIPASMSEANRWTEIGAILALAAYWLPDLNPVPAVKPVPAIPPAETPTAVFELPDEVGPDFF